MRLTVKQLRRVIQEAMRNNAQFAPTDDDTRIPGHLPSELPKSASLEDDVLDEEAWMPGRWMPGEGESVSPRDMERLGDKRAMESTVEENDDDEERCVHGIVVSATQGCRTCGYDRVKKRYRNKPRAESRYAVHDADLNEEELEFKHRVHKALGMCPVCEEPMVSDGEKLYCRSCEDDLDEVIDIYGGGWESKDPVYKLARRAQATR